MNKRRGLRHLCLLNLIQPIVLGLKETSWRVSSEQAGQPTVHSSERKSSHTVGAAVSFVNLLNRPL